MHKQALNKHKVTLFFYDAYYRVALMDIAPKVSMRKTDNTEKCFKAY